MNPISVKKTSKTSLSFVGWCHLAHVSLCLLVYSHVGARSADNAEPPNMRVPSSLDVASRTRQ